MKKALLVLAGVMLLANNAMASKARLSALGQGTNGSPYVNDIRAIYYNPANVTKTEFVTFEFGNGAGATATAAPTAPNAEGGFVKKLNGNDFGVTLGRRSGRFDTLVGLANADFPGAGPSASDLLVANNSTELFYGKMGEHTWGVALLIAQGEEKQQTAAAATPDQTASTVEVRAGILKNEWQAYAELYPIAKSTTDFSGTNQTAEGKFGAKVGGTYDLTEGRVYGDVTFDGAKWNNTSRSVDKERDTLVVNGGFAQTQKVGEGVDFIWSGGLTYDTATTKDKTTSQDTKSNKLYLPLVVALEAAATDWMTLRGSVAQRVLLDRNDNGTAGTAVDSHAANTTTVAAGAGFKWKKLLMDANLEGSNGASGNAGKVNGTALLANASLSYLF